jgi:hypothetical protein
MKDESYISCEEDFRKINFRNYSTYFYKGAPLPRSGFRTVNVLMTHSLPFDDIMKLAGMNLMEAQCGLFRRTLQAEKTTTIGWAYMSTKHIYKQILAAAITETLQVPVGLQWRVVTTGAGFNNVAEEDKVRAIHFEVEDCDVAYAKRELGEIYHHKRTDGFPLGMKFRFMPMYANVPNTEGQQDLISIMGYQQRYCKYIGEYVNGDIVDIDGVLPNGQTLRQHFMAIRVDNNPRKPLFMAINRTYDGKAYVYTILPTNRDLASVTVQHILTQLHFVFPEESRDGVFFPNIDKWFYTAALERASDTIWDPVKGCAVAIISDNMRGIMAAMLEEDEFVTFHPREEEDKEETEKEKEGATADKEKLMIDEDGKSIITRSRANKRVALVNRRTSTQSSRVSFGDSVASPITTDGTQTQRSVMTEAECKTIYKAKCWQCSHRCNRT